MKAIYLLLALVAIPFAIAIARLARRLGTAVWLILNREHEPSASIGLRVRLSIGALLAGTVAWFLGIGLPTVLPHEWTVRLALPLALTMLVGSLLLGLASGMGGATAEVLDRPRRQKAIVRAITMKERVWRALRRFLPVAVLVLVLQAALVATPAYAAPERIWVVAVDQSPSVLEADLERATQELASTAPALVQRQGITRILVLRFTNGGALSDSSWIDVPPPPSAPPCDLSHSAMPQKGLAGIFDELDRRRDARSSCEQEHAEALLAHEESLRAIGGDFRDALAVDPVAGAQTDLVRLIRDITGLPGVCLLTVVSDGIDESGVPLDTLDGAIAVPTILALTRADPTVYAPETARSWAVRWQGVDGIDVVPVSFLAARLPSVKSQP